MQAPLQHRLIEGKPVARIDAVQLPGRRAVHWRAKEGRRRAAPQIVNGKKAQPRAVASGVADGREPRNGIDIRRRRRRPRRAWVPDPLLRWRPRHIRSPPPPPRGQGRDLFGRIGSEKQFEQRRIDCLRDRQRRPGGATAHHQEESGGLEQDKFVRHEAHHMLFAHQPQACRAAPAAAMQHRTEVEPVERLAHERGGGRTPHRRHRHFRPRHA